MAPSTSPPAPRAVLLLVLASTGCHPALFDERAWVSDEVGTVIEVEWEPAGGGEAWVEFGPTEDYGHTTPAVPDGDAPSRTTLLGNKPHQQVHWRVVASHGGRMKEGRDNVTETRGVAAALPDWSLIQDEGCHDGWLLGVSWAAESFLFALDPDADVVWYHALPLTKVTLALEPVPGEPMLRFLEVSMDHDLDDSRVRSIGLEGTVGVSTEIEQGHHAFVAHEDGSLAWLAIDLREQEDGEVVVGDRVMVRDGVTGTTTQLFTTWDHLDYDPDATIGIDFYPQGTDWTHANALRFSEARGSYWLTLGGVNQVLELDAETGEILTTVGSEGYEPEPALPYWGEGFGPHDASWTPDDTLLLFDNAYHDDAVASRILEYDLDHDQGLARQIWDHEGDEGWLTMVLGGTDRLDDGRTLVHWGNEGYLQLLDASGEPCWLARQSSIVADAVVLRDLYGRE